MSGGGGFGSIHHMILTLKNNKDLLKRRGLIQRKKDFYSVRKEYLKASKGKLDFKKASKEEIASLKLNLKKRRRKKNIISILTFSIIFTAACIISLIVIKKDNIKQKNYEISSEIRKENLKKRDHAYLLKWGDYNFNNKDYGAAILDYQEALKLYPNDFNSNLKLAETYKYYCLKFPYEYNKSKDFFKLAIEIFPDSIKLYKIRADLRLSMGELKQAEEDLRTIDELLLKGKNK